MLPEIDDLHIIAMTLEGEAGNQGSDGLHAVANVIQRRVALKWQGETTARGVCLHPWQFSCWEPGPDYRRIMALNDNNGLSPDCLMLAQGVIANTLPDITGGADSYQVVGTNAYWSKGLTPVTVIGTQEFYITRGQK